MRHETETEKKETKLNHKTSNEKYNTTVNIHNNNNTNKSIELDSQTFCGFAHCKSQTTG